MKKNYTIQVALAFTEKGGGRGLIAVINAVLGQFKSLLSLILKIYFLSAVIVLFFIHVIRLILFEYLLL